MRQEQEATYLAWLDIEDLQLRDSARFFENAGVGLSPGRNFGDHRFVRLNFGCRRETLQEALIRMKAAWRQ